MLTRLHTPCPVLVVLHSLHCALVFQCFFSCAFIFNHALGYILKQKFFRTTNMFSVLGFCCRHPVPTLCTWNAVYMFFFGRLCLGFIFCFRYCSHQEYWFITADQTVFKSDGKGRGPGFCFPIKWILRIIGECVLGRE